MVIKEDKQRLHRLLADAIPLLCKSGLPFKATFCIEALIGITLEDDDVMLVSFKQEIRSDQDSPKDRDMDPTSGDEDAAKSRETKSSHSPAAEGKTNQDELRTDEVLSEGRSSRNAHKTIPRGIGGRRTSPKNSVLPVVKVEDIALKMEEDVETVSNSCRLQFEHQDDFVTDSLSWNFHKYVFPNSSTETAPDDEECAGFVTQASWKGDRRTGNKIGRKRSGQSTNGSISHEELAHVAPADAGDKEMHWKRKDGRSTNVAAASSNSTSLSYNFNAQNECGLNDTPAENHDSSVNQSILGIQLTDDRIGLEQTCKILASYRFASSDDNLYSCHICEAKLRGRQTLNEHIRGTHLCAHIYRCPNCGMSFKWRSGLQRHRSRCTTANSAAETQEPMTDI